MGHLPQHTRIRTLGTALDALAVVAALASAPSHAEDITELSRLVHDGRTAQALARIDSALVGNPRDAQLRFLKGVILTEQHHTADAIVVFLRLTDDYPALPEPYNNLAVLYAATRQYDKALAALDAALRINPSYATAHQNLGDLYAKLATQSYQKAMQYGARDDGVKAKLQLAASVAGIRSSAVVTASHPLVGVPKPTTLFPAATNVSPAASPAASGQDEIKAVVLDWARSWSTKDVARYLTFYAGDFSLPEGQNREEWEHSRLTRIAGKGNISVKIEHPRITIDGSTAVVTFQQKYASDRFRDSTRKTLVMTRQDGMWKIRRETTDG